MEVAEDWCSLRQSNSCPAGNQIAVTVTPDCAGAGVSRLRKELDLFIRFIPGLQVPKHIFKGTGRDVCQVSLLQHWVSRGEWAAESSSVLS